MLADNCWDCKKWTHIRSLFNVVNKTVTIISQCIVLFLFESSHCVKKNCKS